MLATDLVGYALLDFLYLFSLFYGVGLHVHTICTWKFYLMFFGICIVIDVTISNLGLQRAALVGPPDVLISTPACIAKCLSGEILQATSINGSLETLVLDEVKLDTPCCLFSIFVYIRS